MSQDREVCICFHVSHRKLTSFVRLHQPKFPSQMSECFGAGTGCGWCRPVLKKIFEQFQANSSVERQECEQSTKLLDEFGAVDWENLSIEQYAQQRAKYIRRQKEKDPEGDKQAD